MNDSAYWSATADADQKTNKRKKTGTYIVWTVTQLLLKEQFVELKLDGSISLE